MTVDEEFVEMMCIGCHRVWNAIFDNAYKSATAYRPAAPPEA